MGRGGGKASNPSRAPGGAALAAVTPDSPPTLALSFPLSVLLLPRTQLSPCAFSFSHHTTCRGWWALSWRRHRVRVQPGAPQGSDRSGVKNQVETVSSGALYRHHTQTREMVVSRRPNLRLKLHSKTRSPESKHRTHSKRNPNLLFTSVRAWSCF